MSHHYRNAMTGEYVTEEYARKHPDTTVRESGPPPKPVVVEQPEQPEEADDES